MTRIVAVLLLLALLAAACGGAESDGAEKWAAAANGLCRDLERELAAVDPPREVEEPDELSAFVAAPPRASKPGSDGCGSSNPRPMTRTGSSECWTTTERR